MSVYFDLAPFPSDLLQGWDAITFVMYHTIVAAGIPVFFLTISMSRAMIA
jgi:hypothetical protein